MCSEHGLARTEPRACGVAWTRPRVLFVLLLFVLLALSQSPFRLALVVGTSMAPGLKTGDLLVVKKRAYGTGEPHRGDIVLARLGKELIVKRIVGLPGEEVKIGSGRLYINGRALSEPYVVESGRLEIRSGKLRHDKYALVGDNRGVSAAEAVPAVVPKTGILGKVVLSLRLWP